MRLLLILLAALATASADPFAELVRPTGPLTPQEEQAKLHVPPGFSVQLFACEPMIHKPINIAFDERGAIGKRIPFPARRQRGGTVGRRPSESIPEADFYHLLAYLLEH